MPSRELLDTWKRTESFLREALESVPPHLVDEYHTVLAQYAEYISHNELELAMDTLAEVLSEAGWNRVAAASMASAARNMGLDARAAEFEQELASLGGGA